MKIAELIDLARAKRGITSDTAVAEHFGLNRQSVSKWRKGEAYPTQDHITELAEMAEENPARWLVAVQAEREKGRAGRIWTALAKQLGAAAVVVLAVALPWPSKAADIDQAERDAALYIMRNWLRGLVARFASMARRFGAVHASAVLA